MDDNDRVGKRGPGRPKKEPSERLSRTVFFRLTFQDWTALGRIARAAGREHNSFCRDIVIERIRTV